MTSPMTMVERVGQAILAIVPQGYGMTKAEAIEYARAAIEAMREPTEEMVNIGQNKCDDYLDAAECWAAMIDSALSEHQTETREK